MPNEAGRAEAKPGRVKNVNKIAVLRANALGDFMVSLPALEALRTAYPQAEIVLLAKAWHAQFLANRPGPVDRVVVVPPVGGVGEQPGIPENPAQIEAFFEQMIAERFDLALQLHGGGRYSNPFLQRLGARVDAGLQASDAPPLDRNVPYIFYHPEILRYLEVVKLVGAAVVTVEPRLSVTERDRAEAYEVVPDSDRPLVVLHPGASDPARHWPTDRFAAVGDRLRRAGAQVAVIGVASERPLVEAVLGQMSEPALNLCDRLSLGGLTGLLSRCQLIISNDSGPRHLAEAVGAATVGIYWYVNFFNYGSPTRTRHRPVVSWQLNCPVCGLSYTDEPCGHGASRVTGASTEEVIRAALELLETVAVSLF